MIKVVGTSDWHIGKYRGPEKDGQNLRFLDICKCLDEFVNVTENEKPDYTLVSGDVFNAGKVWSDRCCEEILVAARYITNLSKASGHVIVMRGTPNHDGIAQFNVLSKMFFDYQNVHIITAPQVLHFDNVDIAVLPGFEKGIFRAKFPGLSGEKENEVFTQELSNIVLGLKAQCRRDKKNILMAHYTIPGCNTESGQIMMLTQFEPILTREVLLTADYNLVALGHIHKPQMVEGYKNIYYQGAVSQLNFNDENQERGCFTYEIEGNGVVTSKFHKFPTREFQTIELTNDDISQFNTQAIDFVATMKWRGKIDDKIVRVHYSCSDENNKALNKAVLEKQLLDDGAFMVWEILPDKIDEFANRTELANTTDPEINLIKYLEEKEFPTEKVQELVLKARPVIEEAEASMTAVSNIGIFEPIEISVKNYRNYEEETFNFEDITFCTINGQNGAGKSSLFMDAIIDCLFEEPREGFVKDVTKKSPWLRNDEKAHSGSIMFTFRIGKKKYRVTRTRARSGKGTLNISQFMDGEWKNCSKERHDDTHQEILNVIGMDSLTFKSCALIMQDQYGLFLQAKPEKRIEVLGTLLGLGIYQSMEKIVFDKAKVYGAKDRELKQEVEIHNNTISSYGNPDEELAACQIELAGYESILRTKTAERDKNKLLLASRQEAAERRIKLLADIQTLRAKKVTAEQNRKNQQAIADSSLLILNDKAEIEAKSSEYRILLERERKLAGESALYSSKKQEAENLARQAAADQEAVDAYKARVRQKENELLLAQPTEQDTVVKEKAAEYEQQKKALDEAYEKERSYRAVKQKLTLEKHNMQQLATQYNASVQRMQLAEDGLKKKAELLTNVECVDIANAKCGFLADAISVKQLLEKYPEQYAERKKVYEEQAEPINLKITELEKQLLDMNFDIEAVAEISRKVSELRTYVTQLEVINQRENKIALLKADLERLQSNILEAEKRLAEVKLKGIETERERDRYAKAFDEHREVLNSITILKPWLEKEKQIPVAEERNATALNRISELMEELAGIDIEP